MTEGICLLMTDIFIATPRCGSLPVFQAIVLALTQLSLAGPCAAESRNMPDEHATRMRIRQALRVPDELPELAAIVHRSFRPTTGVRTECITYSTLLGLRVPVILYLPDPLPVHKIPGLIVVNGHGGDK